VDLLVRTKQYYPGGKAKIIQTKNRRTEYYENGNIQTAYTWTRKKQDIIKGEQDYTYTITKKVFDTTGALAELQVYEYRHIYWSQPLLDFRKCDWINKWIKWDNGKKIIVAIDEYPDEYFKKGSQ
jgi:hypothetical protein